MIIYKPTFTNKWSVDQFDSDGIRYITDSTLCQWNNRVGCYGRVFDKAEPFFTTEHDAWSWIHKEYVPPEGRFTKFKKRGEK